MRAFTIAVLVLVAQISPAGQQKALPEKAANTFTAFALLVGEFYVAQHKWPTSEKQLRQYTAELTRGFPPDSREIIPILWSHMRRVEFTPRGRDVVVSTRFHEDGRDYSYAAILHPGRSAEEIANKMTPK